MNRLCNNCVYLCPTEQEQNESTLKPKPPHKCSKHNWTLHHAGMHPFIPTPTTCEGPYGVSDVLSIELNSEK